MTDPTFKDYGFAGDGEFPLFVKRCPACFDFIVNVVGSEPAKECPYCGSETDLENPDMDALIERIKNEPWTFKAHWTLLDLRIWQFIHKNRDIVKGHLKVLLDTVPSSFVERVLDPNARTAALDREKDR